MAIDMNVDVGELIKGLFSKKSNESEGKSQPSPYLKIVLHKLQWLKFLLLQVFLQIITQRDHVSSTFQISY